MHVDAERVAMVYAQVVGAIGSFHRMGEPVAFRSAEITTVNVPLLFEAGKRTGHVSFDQYGQVAAVHPAPTR